MSVRPRAWYLDYFRFWGAVVALLVLSLAIAVRWLWRKNAPLAWRSKRRGYDGRR